MHKKIAVLGLFLFALAGCQIQGYNIEPLYQNKTIPNALKKVYVPTMYGKYGVHLHNKLEYLLSPTGSPRYRLSVVFKHAERELAIANDDSSARNEIRVVLQFTLTYIDGSGKTDKKFSTIGLANYNALSSPYITEVSRESAYKDALSSAASTGVLRLAVLLGNK